MLPRPPGSPLFPYTTLFRSQSKLESRHTFVPSFRIAPHRETSNVDPVTSAYLVAIPRRSARRVHNADRKSTRLNSSHITTSYAVFCLKKKSRPTKCLTHRAK